VTNATSTPLAVCHVIHSLGAGGAEQVLTDLARVAGGAGLRLVGISLSPVENPVHARTLRDLGVHVVALDRARWDPRAIGDVRRVIREQGIDVVHTHLKHADTVGGVVARLTGLPLVSTLHLIESPLSPFHRLKLRVRSLVRNRQARRILAVSHAQREWYLASTGAEPSRVVVVPNGVVSPPALDEAERGALRASLGFPDAAVIALMAAVMRPGKGHDVLFDAVRGIPEESPLVVAVAGDGELMPWVRATLDSDRALSRRVRLLGYRHDVPALMQASDIVVHPTDADALPTALIHALAAARPIVASDVGGVPDVVGRDAGILVPPRDPVALRIALERLVTEPGLRAGLGTAGRARFFAEFDAELWARRLRAVYDEARGR